MPAARITFHHEIYNESGKLTCTAWLVLVFVDRKTGKPRKAPDAFLKALKDQSEKTC